MSALLSIAAITSENGDALSKLPALVEEGSVGVEMIALLYYHAEVKTPIASIISLLFHARVKMTVPLIGPLPQLRITLGEASIETLPTPPFIKRGDVLEIDVYGLYQSISDMGLEYSGNLQRIKHVQKHHRGSMTHTYKPRGQDLAYPRESLAYFFLTRLHGGSVDRENVEWQHRYLQAGQKASSLLPSQAYAL